MFDIGGLFLKPAWPVCSEFKLERRPLFGKHRLSCEAVQTQFSSQILTESEAIVQACWTFRLGFSLLAVLSLETNTYLASITCPALT